MRSVALLVLLTGATHAFEFPFAIPSLFKAKSFEVVEQQVLNTTPRIAIIGAGAAGSSAAFWISKAQERFGLDVEIDVYEKASYIGGRSTTVYPYNDKSLPEIELGASIFVKVNKNLWRASNEFNLTRQDFKGDDTDNMGVWDGEKMVITIKDGGWWDTMKVIWKYGITSPKRTDSIVQTMVGQFTQLYASDGPKWDNMADLAKRIGWTSFVASSTSEFFQSKGVSKIYAHEMIEAATRVNYGQNADEIHALEGACSLAANGASSVVGGNFQIFEQFLASSGAKIFLNTSVTSIAPKSSTSHHWTVTTDTGSSTHYKGVILAAPYHSTSIELPVSLADQIPQQPYVHLHVTLLTTTTPFANASYFSLPPGTSTPRMMLTTYEGARNGGKEPEFNSMSYHGLVKDGEWAVKIFSKERIEDAWLTDMFNGSVGWVHRKEWDAYPKLPPTTTFPPVKLDKGFYYVNAFEPFISTMETETIASRNVVDLLLSEEFGSSICGGRIGDSPQKDGQKHTSQDHADYVYGWDC